MMAYLLCDGDYVSRPWKEIFTSETRGVARRA